MARIGGYALGVPHAVQNECGPQRAPSSDPFTCVAGTQNGQARADGDTLSHCSIGWLHRPSAYRARSSSSIRPKLLSSSSATQSGTLGQSSAPPSNGSWSDSNPPQASQCACSVSCDDALLCSVIDGLASGLLGCSVGGTKTTHSFTPSERSACTKKRQLFCDALFLLRFCEWFRRVARSCGLLTVFTLSSRFLRLALGFRLFLRGLRVAGRPSKRESTSTFDNCQTFCFG